MQQAPSPPAPVRPSASPTDVWARFRKTRHTALACLLLVGLVGCDDLEQVERRNEAGVVVERFYRSKTDSLIQGEAEVYDDEGRLLEKATYVDGVFEGERTLYHPSGERQSVETRVGGRYQGPFRAYYPDGQLELEGEYVDDTMTGIWTRYYPDGAKMEEVTFTDGREGGPFREWYPNGQPKASGNYVASASLPGAKEQGELLMYDEAGTLVKRMECDTGICRTVWLIDSTQVTTGG